MRRPQPSHSAALLVDQDRSVAAPDRAAQRGDQITDLVGRAAVAPEQDKTDRISSAEEAAFVLGQLLSGATENDRARCLASRGSRLIGQ